MASRFVRDQLSDKILNGSFPQLWRGKPKAWERLMTFLEKVTATLLLVMAEFFCNPFLGKAPELPME